MTRRALLMAAMTGLLLVADAPTTGAPAPPDKDEIKLPDGVIHVSLPPGTVEWERIFKSGKPLLRVTVGKTVIEARNVFVGDGKAAAEIEATRDGVHWPTAKGGRGPTVGGMAWESTTIGVPAGGFIPVDKLKAGSLYLTTPDPSLRIEFAPKEGPNIPEGVVHVSLPRGTINWDRVFKNGRPILRVAVGKTIFEVSNAFVGDGKAATEYEATKDGILWPSTKSREGPTVGGMEWESGTTGVPPGDFITVDKLKAGSLYFTTQDPGIKFEFPPAAKD